MRRPRVGARFPITICEHASKEQRTNRWNTTVLFLIVANALVRVANLSNLSTLRGKSPEVTNIYFQCDPASRRLQATFIIYHGSRISFQLQYLMPLIHAFEFRPTGHMLILVTNNNVIVNLQMLTMLLITNPMPVSAFTINLLPNAIKHVNREVRTSVIYITVQYKILTASIVFTIVQHTFANSTKC